jgi:hypothetical protein
VTTPVKAHLSDGSTVVYPDGVRVEGNALRGAGERYNIALTGSAPVSAVPLDEVVAMESFRTEVRMAESILVSTLTTTGMAVAATAFFSTATFGSCPTVYSADGTVEEAELFSSSIGPLFEARDLDRLSARPDADGMLTLEVRNEALETHYINNLQLVEVRHGPAAWVLPDAGGLPIVVGGLRAPASVRDRGGRDVAGDVALADGAAYSTPSEVIAAADAGDLDDRLEFTVPVDPSASETALVFRLRNSGLGTVLFYNVMLEPMGAAALDWMGPGLDEISTAVELGRWLGDRAGLKVAVRRDGVFREVARIPDTGPISWHDVAVRIPVEEGESSLDVRLSFVADHWRIDRIASAASVREPELRVVELAEVTVDGGATDPVALERLRGTDREYLETRPGQRFFARFEVGEAPGDRTFLLSSLGYYIEWIRGDWIRQTTSGVSEFAPGEAALIEALGMWREVRPDFEERFRAERVPVGE